MARQPSKRFLTMQGSKGGFISFCTGLADFVRVLGNSAGLLQDVNPIFWGLITERFRACRVSGSKVQGFGVFKFGCWA